MLDTKGRLMMQYAPAIKSAQTKFDAAEAFYTFYTLPVSGYRAYKELIAREVVESGDVKLADLFEVVGDFAHEKTDKKGCKTYDELKQVVLEQAHEEMVNGFLRKAFEKWLAKQNKDD